MQPLCNMSSSSVLWPSPLPPLIASCIQGIKDWRPQCLGEQGYLSSDIALRQLWEFEPYQLTSLSCVATVHLGGWVFSWHFLWILCEVSELNEQLQLLSAILSAIHFWDFSWYTFTEGHDSQCGLKRVFLGWFCQSCFCFLKLAIKLPPWNNDSVLGLF